MSTNAPRYPPSPLPSPGGRGLSRGRAPAAAAAAALAATVAAYPFFWLLLTACRSPDGALSLDAFATLLRNQPVGRWLVNSIFIAATHTVLSIACCSLAGYALAKHSFAGHRAMAALLIGTLLVPPPVLFPAGFELVAKIGWVDRYAAAIVPGIASAFGVLLFRAAAQGVPDELIDAAALDGATPLRTWWHIALPLVQPTTAAVTLMTFVASWNSFIWPQVVLLSQERFTLPIGLANLSALPAYRADPRLLMAGTIVGILPPTLLFFALQRDFIAGLTAGATKG